MLDDYYRIHHWNLATGNPTPEVVKSLGLAEVVKEEEMW